MTDIIYIAILASYQKVSMHFKLRNYFAFFHLHYFTRHIILIALLEYLDLFHFCGRQSQTAEILYKEAYLYDMVKPKRRQFAINRITTYRKFATFHFYNAL